MANIYKVTNSFDGKIYVGNTSSPVEKRWKQHCFNALANMAPNNKFFAAIRKYRPEGFVAELIVTVPDDEADEAESTWIAHYDSFENGYNSRRGGGASALRGRPKTEEHKRKMCLAKLGKPKSEEHRRKMSLSHGGTGVAGECYITRHRLIDRSIVPKPPKPPKPFELRHKRHKNALIRMFNDPDPIFDVVRSDEMMQRIVGYVKADQLKVAA